VAVHINAVVITRPLAQATEFARRVDAIGRQGIIFPLLDIKPLEDITVLQAALAALQRYALVAFVSPNAIHAAFSHLVNGWPASVPIAVIGEGSRTALAGYGVTAENTRIISPRNAERTDSETLLQALDVDVLRNQNVLIIRGESGRELLAEQLRNHGAIVTQVAAYRRSMPSLNAEKKQQLQQLLINRHDWVITSSEALRNLVAMVAQLADQDVVAKMQQQKIIVSHRRIAETAHSEGFLDVLLTGSGDECLLGALQFRL